MNIAEKLLAVDANTDRVEALNLELENILGGHSLPEGSGGGTSIPLQEKTINIVENGTTEVLPDGGYALSKVGVNVNVPIPSGYIKPNGEKEISKNGTYDVAEFEKVNVNVPAPEGDTLTEFLRMRGIENLFNRGTYSTKVISTDVMALLVNSIPASAIKGSANYMFANQKQFTQIPLFDTSKIEYMNSMFYYCEQLTSVPLFDTSGVMDMGNMFNGCKNLTEVPAFNTSKAGKMNNMFYGCAELTSVPLFDTKQVADMGYMFNGCKKLTTIPAFNLRSMTHCASMFSSCANLTEIWIKNIRHNLTVASGTSYGHLLTVDSLVHLCYELRDAGFSRTLTMGATNLAKLADVYVKTIAITDEMRAEDDLIDEKLPFVRCESTDEGAMLIADYVTLKHWALK